MNKRQRELLDCLLSALPQRDQEVLKTRYGLVEPYGEERTLQATAEIVGVTKQAIHKIEKAALQKLRELHREI